MSNNKDKFKLGEDPEVSGGAADGRKPRFCSDCGAKLLTNEICPYCDIELQEEKSGDTGYDQQETETEIPRRRTNRSLSTRNSRKTKRNNW